MKSKLTMRKISEILRQKYELNRSYREIGRSLNISISTVGDYLARAKLAGISWPLAEDLTEEILHAKLFLPSIKQGQKDRPMPDWEWVHKEVRRKGVTLGLLWREYRETHADGICYSQFCYHYQQYAKTIAPVMRQMHKGGEKCFVDYAGMTVPWLDVTTGEVHYAQIFVGALGASQYVYAEATKSQKIPDWTASHVRMLENFEGVPEIIIPDNLKSGVQKAHRYDPNINPNYQCLSEHYGFAIVPARSVKPRDKAKVESAVGCVERQILAPLRHHTFTSIAEINLAIKERLTTFNQQSMQKMKVSRRELYESLDKPVLKALPLERYQQSEWKSAKVHIDYHVVFDFHYYSVPYSYIHQPVEIRSTATTLECFYKGKRIALHTRSYVRYGYTTLTEHMPEAHRVHAEWTPERMRRWANKIGPQTAAFIEQMILSRPFPQQAYRACLGLLRLGQRYGEDRLEKACAKGLKVGISRYQQVEKMLINKVEDSTAAHVDNKLLPRHTNVRGPEYYR